MDGIKYAVFTDKNHRLPERLKEWDLFWDIQCITDV
uniref:Uncharacterized protein n=1 Tax=Brassica oleracea TaxID=3712 RepID=A0A3P6HCI2_BRAOL|nr:unnamed protein product [Brassica oleracea]